MRWAVEADLSDDYELCRGAHLKDSGQKAHR
jgi:hypothetical protein